jgi:uroporphyrinogen-III decarboxylase
MGSLSSRERMLAAIRYETPDRIPLHFKSFGFQPPEALRWANDVEQAERWLSLGCDPWLWSLLPMRFHPDVRVRQWTEQPEGAPWPVLVAEYDTPAGTLRQEVYLTEDWDTPEWPLHHDGAPRLELFDDYNVPRYRRCPIRSEADLEKLKYLLWPMPDDVLADTRTAILQRNRQARELSVLHVGDGSSGTDAAVWLCGVEPLIDLALEQPDLFDGLLEIIHAWDRRNTEILLDAPVDLIMRRGYYEGTSFWSPSLFRRHFAPRLADLAAMIHQGERLMGYIMSVGVMPLLEELAAIGYDMHFLLDPIPNGARIDLAAVKAAFHGKVAVAGALNDPITMETGTREEIRQEVFDAVRLLGPDGLALSPAESIFASTPWESVETVIAAWREVCGVGCGV